MISSTKTSKRNKCAHKENTFFEYPQQDTYNKGYNNTQGNTSAINRLLDVGEQLDEPEPKVVESIMWELRYDERYPFLDYDHIHGTDDPKEIDEIFTQIMSNK